MTDRERTSLSQAIRATMLREGGYSSIVRGAEVRQPVVSLALHRRLVVRTENVDRLFEYLRPNMADATKAAAEPAEAFGDTAAGVPPGGVNRRERLLGLLANLSDGSDAADERLASVLAALGNFADGEHGGRQARKGKGPQAS
jgi:hypothetical protein